MNFFQRQVIKVNYFLELKHDIFSFFSYCFRGFQRWILSLLPFQTKPRHFPQRKENNKTFFYEIISNVPTCCKLSDVYINPKQGFISWQLYVHLGYYYEIFFKQFLFEMQCDRERQACAHTQNDTHTHSSIICPQTHFPHTATIKA